MVAASAAAGDTIVSFDDPDVEAKRNAAFNRAVGALPIDPRDGDQVRVWFFAYWSGEMKVRGYIVTRKGVWRCTLGYKHREDDYAIHSGGSCSGPRRYPERIDAIMALMKDISKLKGADAVCPVLDGWGANVEGIFDGKPFAFEAANTDGCTDTDKNAALANEFLDLLNAAYTNKDDE
jgi:hypothetical protein